MYSCLEFWYDVLFMALNKTVLELLFLCGSKFCIYLLQMQMWFNTYVLFNNFFEKKTIINYDIFVIYFYRFRIFQLDNMFPFHIIWFFLLSFILPQFYFFSVFRLYSRISPFFFFLLCPFYFLTVAMANNSINHIHHNHLKYAAFLLYKLMKLKKL